MADSNLLVKNKPTLVFPEGTGSKLIKLEGLWALCTLVILPEFQHRIKQLGGIKDKQWGISRIEQLDRAAAFILW